MGDCHSKGSVIAVEALEVVALCCRDDAVLVSDHLYCFLWEVVDHGPKEARPGS